MADEDKIVSKTDIEVDGDMSEKKLAQLIKLSTEEERLDYKSTYKIKRNTKDRAELVRDIVGMANTYGGYIVLGVKENKDGKNMRYDPVGLSNEDCAALDISIIREQVENFVSVRTDIKFQLHELSDFQNKKFALIYVPISKESPIILEKDGQYKDKKSGRSKLVFQTGDIVVRKGGSTERVGQSDMRRLISDIRKREKEQWTEEILGMREMVQRLDKLIGVLSSRESDGEDTIPLNVIDYEQFDEKLLYLSPKFFHAEMLKLLERGEDVKIQRFLRESIDVFFESVQRIRKIDIDKDGNDSDILEIIDNRLLPILDNLLAIGVVYVEYELFDKIILWRKIMYTLCKRANSENFPNIFSETITFNNIWLWQEVIKRIYALGALLVDREKWIQAKTLVEQDIEWDDFYRKSYWSKYILVMASRSKQLVDNGWIPSVRRYYKEHNWLANYLLSDQEAITDLLCQFDFLQCVYLESNKTSNSPGAYPSFRVYYRRRTEPVISKLINAEDLRSTLASVSDKKLATIIFDLNKIANEHSPMISGWRNEGWTDKSIPKFIKDNLPKPEE